MGGFFLFVLGTLSGKEGDEMTENGCPAVWPEEAVPEEVRGCKICGLYEHGTRMVWGEGRADAPIMVILDNPGSRENKDGRSYVCPTRETLQRAAFETGLGENDLYLTYILKRRPVRAYDKPKTRKQCMRHLQRQIEEKAPRFIFCLGNVAVQSLFNDPEADVKTFRGDWHRVRGRLTAVSYHPLAVRRRPNLRRAFLEDWRFLKKGYTKYI